MIKEHKRVYLDLMTFLIVTYIYEYIYIYIYIYAIRPYNTRLVALH